MNRAATKSFLFWLATLSNPLLAQQAPRPVDLVPQMSSMWCWAASAQMAMMALGAYEDDVLQRIQAGRAYLPGNSCYSYTCSDVGGGGTSPTCAFGGFPQFNKFGFDADVAPLHRPLYWPELRKELACRPVVFAREDLINGERQGTGHMVVATSAGIADKGPWISINDPGPPCDGSVRSETYQEYLGGMSKVPWIGYYNIHAQGKTLVECAPTAPESSDFAIRESASPQVLVAEFIAAVQDNAWLRGSAGLSGESHLSCDLESAIPEKRISIASLRQAPPGTPLATLLLDVGRLRFLCLNGVSQSFSVVAERQESAMWRVAAIGDVQLATRLRAIRAAKQADQQIQEVFVLGLNVHFARLVGDPPGPAIPLSSVPGYDIPPAPQEEATLLIKLRAAAAIFRATGPT